MAYDDKNGQNGYGQGGYGQGYGSNPYGGYQTPNSPYGYGNYDTYYDGDEDYEEDTPRRNNPAPQDGNDGKKDNDGENEKDEKEKQTDDDTDGEEGVPPKEKKHLSRKDRKALEKRQYELEKKLVKAGKISPRVQYKPHHTFGRILGICLAFFFGIFMALGGIVGGVYIAGTQTKLKNVLNMTGADADKILTESAQQMSLLQLVDEVRADIELLGGFDDFSLEVLAKYTPIVEEQLNNYLGQLSDFGVNITAQQFMQVKFSNLSTFLQDDVIKQIALADISAINTDDPLLHAICFKEDGTKVKFEDLFTNPEGLLEGIALADVFVKEGEEVDPVMNSLLYDKEGNKYKIGDLISDASDIIQSVEIETLLGIDGTSNATMRYLAYGTETDDDGNPRYTVGEDNKVTMVGENTKRTVSDLTDEDADLIGGAKICDLVVIDEGSSGIMKAMQNWSVNDLSDQDKIESLFVKDVFELKGNETGLMGAISEWTLKDVRQSSRIERLKISQIIDLSNSSSALLSAIGDWRIQDLKKQEKIDSLTISDVIAVNANSPLLLQAVQGAPLGELGDAVNALRLCDILSEEDLSGNKLLRNLKTSTLSTLSDDVKALSVADVFGEEIYSYLDVSATKAAYDAAAAEYAGEDIGIVANGTYAELVNAYEKNRKFEKLSEVVPQAVKPAEGEKIESYRVPASEAGNANPARLTLGYFTQSGGNYHLENADKIFRGNGAYTVERRLALTPEYEWKLVNYASGGLAALPAGDSVTEKDGGYVYRTADAEYPVSEDGSGYFYKTGDVRVDLERETVSYLGGSARYPVTNGKITYDSESYTVRKDDAGNYVLIHIPVTPYYYAPTAAEIYTTVYAENETVMRHALIKDDGTESVLDRYLSGIWYLLLGGEEKQADGSLVIIDNSESSVLDIGGKISGAADAINEYDLGEMYLHGFITASPYRDIGSLGFKGFNNLNDLSIADVIDLVGYLMDLISA